MRRAFTLLSDSAGNVKPYIIKLPQIPEQFREPVPLPQAESQSEKAEEKPANFSERDLHRARGYLKYVKPYEPPADLENILRNIFIESSDIGTSSKISKITKDNWQKLKLSSDASLKFRILSSAEKQLGKTVPNSYLHEIQNGDDLLKFYSTGVSVVAQYNEVARNPAELPPNLHMIEECVRYDPIRDGPTAFPLEDRKIVNPRFRKLYDDIIAKKEWHEFESKRARPEKSASPEEDLFSTPKKSKRFDTINPFGLKFNKFL